MTDFPAMQDSRFGGLDSLVVRGSAGTLAAPVPVRLWDAGNGVLAAIKGESTVRVQAITDYPARVSQQAIGDTWYEIIHVFPFSFSFGNVLTTVTEEIEIYNADRFSDHTLSTFTNNAGDGISIPDLPSIPYTMFLQTGITLTLEVTSDGPPTINGTLDFVFDLYTFSLPLTGNRIVMFPFEPEVPLVERLRFLTDIIERKDGTEQRISLRGYPRQEYSLEVYREEGEELTRFEILMFDWQARVFGLPVWSERTNLVSAAATDDTVITVKSTASADYRVGGLAIMWSSETDFESLEVSAIGASTITFATPIVGNFPVGTLVMPIRTANASKSIRGTRWSRNLAKRDLQFRVLDNDVGASFADATPYTVDDSSSVLDGEIFLADAIPVEGTLSESFDRRVTIFDNSTGKQSVGSTTDFNRRSYPYRFVPKTRAELWQVRRLLHALNGRQVSFFVPTAFRDLTVVDLWGNGTATLDVTNVGFTQFARQRNRFNVVRIELTDGTLLDATITASSVVSLTVERLTLSLNAPRDIEASEFARVDFVERVRIDSDDITITHIDGLGQSVIAFSVRSLIT